MTPLVTVVIPISPAHENIADRAVASAQAQTVLVDIIPFYDKQKHGTGHARNQGARDCITPFVTFLDADDTLDPTFIEKSLNAYTKGHYVYTGWNMGSKQVMPMEHTPYLGEGCHLVTTLIPTAAFRAVGEFDEDLPGYEDADLHLKLAAAGICGTLVPEYLVNYSWLGARSRAFDMREDRDTIRKMVYERNGGRQTIMCCGQTGTPTTPSPGDKQEGDVLAVAQWSGIQSMASADGTRIYRGGNWSQIWVSPKDIEARPDLFKRTYSVADLTPDKEDVLKAAGLI